MFGEIDCREGLLLAVEKLKYDSLDEAMAVLIDIYAHALLDLIKTRHFKIFVHPVPSVLNETRHVVRPFNEALQKKVGICSKEAFCSPFCWSNGVLRRKFLQTDQPFSCS